MLNLTDTREIMLTADTMDAYIALFGLNDRNISMIEQECSVQISLRGNQLLLRGEAEPLRIAEETIHILFGMIERNEPVDRVRIRYVISMVKEGNGDRIEESLRKVIAITHRGKQVTCKTLGQQVYIDTIRKNTLTFAVGPAGTGKTYLAVAQAAQELKEGSIERIIMSRPAIEAGEERLGFLPGDLAQKVDPYLRPLYDALRDVFGQERADKLRENGVVEVAPLAYMRGRTLNRARIIIDEGQNASLSTLKMALTRLGEDSRMVLTGDVTQIDLPKISDSGLSRCAEILRGVEGIGVIHLNNRDVVRNKIVKDIVKAFEKEEAMKAQNPPRSRRFKQDPKSGGPIFLVKEGEGHDPRPQL